MSNNKQIPIEKAIDVLAKELYGMSENNNKKSSIEQLESDLKIWFSFVRISFPAEIENSINRAKAMQQEQAQLYATFVLTCVNNNLPPITFNDWINLDNNEETKNT